MTQLARWALQTFESLTGPKAPSPEIAATIEAIKHAKEVITPQIKTFLGSRGYGEEMVGCAWRGGVLCVVVKLSQPPTEPEILHLAEMATPFPLGIEVIPELREICAEILTNVIKLGMQGDIIVRPDVAPLLLIRNNSQKVLAGSIKTNNEREQREIKL